MIELDKKWVSEQLKLLPTPPVRQAALVRYYEVFKQAHDAELLPHKKDNTARRTANTRLRLYVAKVLKSMQEYNHG